jgi:hypothetical protein
LFIRVFLVDAISLCNRRATNCIVGINDSSRIKCECNVLERSDADVPRAGMRRSIFGTLSRSLQASVSVARRRKLNASRPNHSVRNADDFSRNAIDVRACGSDPCAISSRLPRQSHQAASASLICVAGRGKEGIDCRAGIRRFGMRGRAMKQTSVQPSYRSSRVRRWLALWERSPRRPADPESIRRHELLSPDWRPPVGRSKSAKHERGKC